MSQDVWLGQGGQMPAENCLSSFCFKLLGFTDTEEVK